MPPGSNAALPPLPAGLTHLTLGVRQGQSGAGGGWDPHLLGQARTAFAGSGICLCFLCRCAAVTSRCYIVIAHPLQHRVTPMQCLGCDPVPQLMTAFRNR